MSEGVLAHAFGPGEDIGGDVHFNYQLEWDLDQRSTSESSMNFFAVVLHEIGHSLGLSHSENPEAVMYDWYNKNSGTLSVEDVERIHRIYGIPDGFNNDNDVTSEKLVTTDTPTTTPLNVPNRCDTTYDAITIIHGEVFIFKDTYMWRPQHGDNHSPIRGMWLGLPRDFTHVDAVFQDDVGRISFFTGRNVYVFKGNTFAYRTTLTRYGIDQSVDKIDTIFKWFYNQRTYIFSGDKFWRLDGDFVAKNYPKSIRSRWRFVNRIQTSFSNETNLYFLVNKYLFEFNHHTMSLDHHSYQLASQVFMRCPHVSNSEKNPLSELDKLGDTLSDQDHSNLGSISYLWLYIVLTVIAVVVVLVVTVLIVIFVIPMWRKFFR